jgi:predicted anti-sigma-YlaC factor YlaD
MKFECGDLERALAISDLMPEAREHLKSCATCRREYRLWTEISSSARELHEEWESADLWPKIRQALEAERKPARPWWKESKTWALAAVLAVAVLIPLRFWHRTVQPQASPPAQIAAKPARTDQDFLTDQALREVERNEAAYRQSIDKLSRLAQPKLATAASPSVANAREKLLLLDSAIADTRANVASNRFNVHLQTTLADLYREKQQTLQELLARDRKN